MTAAEDTVFVAECAAPGYPDEPPFHPDNSTYRAVQQCFALAGLDRAHLGEPGWNPLGELMRTGETVLLKPNFVKENHPRDPNGWRCVLTHGSIIRAVADYVWKAVGVSGKVVVADAPQTDSSFGAIAKVTGLHAIRDHYARQGLDFAIVDLRREEHENRGGVIVARRRLAGDPEGYVAFDLGNQSEFVGHRGAGRYYGADYDAGEVNRHHADGRHEYLISGTAIRADVVFSLPKLKTHKKAGITVSMKNLVGINGDKNWLPHHTEGKPARGGDEHPAPSWLHRFERRVVPGFRYLSRRVPGVGIWAHRLGRRVGTEVFGDTEDVIRSGNWWGNDTVWRMCLDLKVLLYGNPDGTLRAPTAGNRKRHYVLVDGILAGEGRGPMNPDPVDAGIVVFGVHPPSVDAACAYLMGFDPDKVPIVRQAFLCSHLPLAESRWQDVRLVSERPAWNGLLPEIGDAATFHFTPHFGWTGQIERGASAEAA